MNKSAFLATLAFYLAKYFPEQLDLSLKPKDSAGCIPCRDIKFDFIVVGAGSAGCVVANRLSENPNWKVLLIEAGGDEDYVTDTPSIIAPAYGGTKYDWNYTTAPQRYKCLRNGGICKYERGHVMGGSSSINGMMLVRGTPDDFNEWERMGNPGWGYKDVLPYFRKLEKMTIPELMNSPYHSTKGLLSVGRPSYNNDIFDDVLKAAKESGLPELHDYNGVRLYGVGKVQSAIKGPNRCSTSKAYLDPIRNRPNLYVFKNTMVTKILFSDLNSRKAIGVSCITDGKEYNVLASKEVVLSAGVTNTPKLLMLSGIGPKNHLDELDIPVRVDLPVGETFLDHTIAASQQFTTSKGDLDYNDKRATNAIIDYARHRRGVLTSPMYRVTIFTNSSTNVLDTQIILMVNMNGLGESIVPNIGFGIVHLHPKSVGTLRLKSANPMDAPLIDPKYLENKDDMIPLKFGIKKLMELIKTPSLSKYCPVLMKDIFPECPVSDPLTDTDMECIIRHDMGTGLHGVGTAKMGPRYDKTAVVDPSLRVHGVSNLRVVDASVFPRITSGNTHLPTVMVGEKGSDLIKRCH